MFAVLSGVTALAYEPTLDRRAIDEALALGQSRIESIRAKFHQPYRIYVGRSPVDYIDIVTPFRRVEMEAESRGRNATRMLSQREAMEILDAAQDGIDAYLEMTFHPMHTYVGVPEYQLRLVLIGRANAPAIEPREVQRVPRYGARIQGQPLPTPGAPALAPGREPMLGGTTVARFDGRLLDPKGVYDLVLSEAGMEIGRARIDFRALR